MREREPRKEIIGKGELLFLGHPGTEDTFSGYGLTVQPARKEFLVGVLMVDRPAPADPDWLRRVEETFGACELVAMTATGERGIECQMQIAPDSLSHLRQFPGRKTFTIRDALNPLLEDPPKPTFTLRWDEDAGLWRSEMAPLGQLPPEIREVFEQFGYGCLAAETNIGVIHVCHAADADVEGFKGKPVSYQWQLIKMPTYPLIRLEITIFDQPGTPYRFESFLNVADDDQGDILAQLASQDALHLAFYGDNLTHRFTKTVAHGEQQWQQLDEIVEAAIAHWHALPAHQRDFDRAKAAFMRRFV